MLIDSGFLVQRFTKNSITMLNSILADKKKVHWNDDKTRPDQRKDSGKEKTI